MERVASAAGLAVLTGCEPPVSLPPEPRLTELGLTTDGETSDS